MATDEGGLNLFDETASAAGSFPSARRGYDREAVDDYVRSLESTVVNARRHIRGLEDQINSLEQRLDALEAESGTDQTVDYTNLGGRATDILRLAEEQARDVVEQAHVEAERVKESARREAGSLLISAERDGSDTKTTGLAELQQLRARGERDARNQLEKATAESAALVAAARREADLIRRHAEQETQVLRQQTYLDTEAQRRGAEKDAAEIRQQVAAEREQAIAHLRAVHEEAVASTAALLAEASQHATESRERLEADVADAARIRAEAQAEAEQVKLTAIRETEERIALAKKQAAAINERTSQEFAWRKEQLRRETDLLSQRKQAVLNQLASLSALAEQTAHNFPDLGDLEDFEAESPDQPGSGQRPEPSVSDGDEPHDPDATVMVPVVELDTSAGDPDQPTSERQESDRV